MIAKKIVTLLISEGTDTITKEVRELLKVLQKMLDLLISKGGDINAKDIIYLKLILNIIIKVI